MNALSASYELGRWQHAVDEGRVQCDLCPRYCRLHEGQRAFCFVPQNVGGQIYLASYGRATGFCVDPIEKKPLNHFYPGSSVLSFGTAGCNLGCKFCQNWDISKAKEIERLSDRARPEQIAEAAQAQGARSVAFTYNDPVIFAEYAIDTAKACRERGVNTVAVTAGYITPEARKDFFEYIDAANIDLKAFTPEFYKKLCYAELEPVLDTLRYLKAETNVWFEVTTLLIPGHNDSDAEIGRLCDWFLENLGPSVPLHFSAFHPDFRMLDVPATPPETCKRARELARAAGVEYVYSGNIHDEQSQSTYCPGCGECLIERDWYELGKYSLRGNACSACGQMIAGRFSPDGPGAAWGRKRLRIAIG
ncbi:MAG TPA: AmmeMemoRadiSam system radical SAM enzyme [Polyangiaceae bacterium]|nr:AmmeMemoRadiSam system radical SAM enzyme [Polyangiaceae bacterium]HMR75915.1 AmmeMemoRadiSam system radical SAM enzyme [Polyangiaceae bacterium]